MESSRRFDARVLVADDNPVDREILRAILQNFGCQVDVVTREEEALAALSRRYQLVFVERTMPKMDAAVHAIRAGEKAQHLQPADLQSAVPIIAFTVDPSQEAAHEYAFSGIDGYLNKPFSPERVGAVLGRWVPEKGGENRAEASHEVDPKGSPIDSAVFVGIRGLGGKNGKAFLTKVVETYLKTSPRYLQALRESAAAGDARGMQRAAHAFKSSNGNMGALGLAAFCEELSRMGLANTTRGAEALILKIETEYEAVKEALQKELNRL